MRALRAPPIEHELVLGVANVDTGFIRRARVSARVGADRVSAGALLLSFAGSAEAVR